MIQGMATIIFYQAYLKCSVIILNPPQEYDTTQNKTQT
jgi:hypothetical protein